MGTITQYGDLIIQAIAPWFSEDAKAEAENTNFQKGAARHDTNDTQEQIAKCLSCTHAECVNCYYREQNARQKRKHRAQAKDLIIRKCEVGK